MAEKQSFLEKVGNTSVTGIEMPEILGGNVDWLAH